MTVRDNVNPALRAVNDVFALIKDDRLPDEIRARVLPGLFRMAVESAARQAYYTKQSMAGRARSEFEDAWTSAKKTVVAAGAGGEPSTTADDLGPRSSLRHYRPLDTRRTSNDSAYSSNCVGGVLPQLRIR